MISKVPRPFGELTHPSWCPEDVAFVVLAATASPRYRLKMRRRCAIAPCAYCPPAIQDSGITACSGGSSLHLLVGLSNTGRLNQGLQGIRATLWGFEDRAMRLEAPAPDSGGHRSDGRGEKKFVAGHDIG